MKNSYWKYIKVEELLDLQSGIDDSEQDISNEEVLFIVVHQVHELWFKLVLRELTTARDLFKQDPVPETSLANAARGLRRISRIFRLGAEHFSLMETMTTRDFLDFRDKLASASGFQSAQFREIEIVMGLSSEERIRFGKEDSYLDVLREENRGPSSAMQRVEERLQDRPSLREALEQWLYRTPILGSVPTEGGDVAVVQRFLDSFLKNHRREIEGMMARAEQQAITPEDVERLRARYTKEMADARAFLSPPAPRLQRTRAALLFLESYRELPLLSWPREILDLTIEMEQAFLIFRQRHARMVERMIGRRVGTGGSDGVDYLDETALRYRVFRDFWEVRTILLKQLSIPKLSDSEKQFYEFRNQ